MNNVYSYSLPFFNSVVFLLLTYKSSLYIADTRPLSDMWFAIIFSHFLGCLHFFDVSSEAQKFLIVMRSNVPILFVICAFGIVLRNHCLIKGQKDLLYVLF